VQARLRGPRGVKLVASGAHEGIEAAISKLLNAIWHRRRGHFMRTHWRMGKSGRRAVSAFIATAFVRRLTCPAPAGERG
jgi:putative transposase